MRRSQTTLVHIRYRSAAVFLVSAFVLVGCSKKPTPPELAAKDYSESGWSKFQAEDYGTARAEFDQAIEKDSNYADGYLGAGWIALYSGETDTALARFTFGRWMADSTATVTDFDAGIAIASFQVELYAAAIAAVDSCLARSPEYSFNRRESINRIDLLATKANAYFQMGGDSNLVNAAALVSEIIPEINLDPGNIDSWFVDGSRYDTFSEALLRALEKVSAFAASS